MIKQTPTYTVAYHPSGKRVPMAINGRATTNPINLAQSLGITKRAAEDVIAGSNNGQAWHSRTMQRRRETMRISYKITTHGMAWLAEKEAARIKKEKLARIPLSHKIGAFEALVRACEMGEASDISEAMLAAGYDQHIRSRVLIDAARASSQGLINVKRESGRIFGNIY